nr:hypothetical protein [Tanacetum cinerariifolium]
MHSDSEKRCSLIEQNHIALQNTTLKARVTGKQNSGSKSLAKPKVIATGMVSDTTKYIPPQRRLNRVAPTPYPTKKQVTFQGNPRHSSRPTPTRMVQQQQQPTIPISHSTRQRSNTKEQIEEKENRAIANNNETPAQKAAKRRRILTLEVYIGSDAKCSMTKMEEQSEIEELSTARHKLMLLDTAAG